MNRFVRAQEFWHESDRNNSVRANWNNFSINIKDSVMGSEKYINIGKGF